LVNSLENWWLGFWKCLLIGELSDPTDKKLLNHTTSSVVDLLKKMKRILTSDEEAWIRLLISCFCYLNHQQLVRGLLKILNTTVRSPIMQEVLSLFKNVQPDLEKFKTAKRNPVILVLDKVGQLIHVCFFFCSNTFFHIFVQGDPATTLGKHRHVKHDTSFTDTIPPFS
jgi:hypothetical protein